MLVSRNIFQVRLFSFSTLCRVQTNSMHFAPLVLDFFFLAWNPISYHLTKQLTIARDKQTNSTSRPMTIFTKTFSSLDTKCQSLSFSQCRKTKNSHLATSASSFAFSSPNSSPLLLQIWQLFVRSIWSTLGVPTLKKGWVMDISNNFSWGFQKSKFYQRRTHPVDTKRLPTYRLGYRLCEQSWCVEGVCLIKKSRRVLILELKN